MKKLVAIATLAAFLSFNPLTAIVAEARHHRPQRPISHERIHHRERPRHGHHHHRPRYGHHSHRHHRSRDVIGGILIGTVIGTVIANNNRCHDCERDH